MCWCEYKKQFKKYVFEGDWGFHISICSCELDTKCEIDKDSKNCTCMKHFTDNC